MKFIPKKTSYKILFGIILFLILVVIASLFAAPRLARKYIVINSYEYTGRHIEIGKITLNYFTGTLTIHDLSMYERDSSSVFMGFKRFSMDINYQPLFHNELNVSSMVLDGLYAQVLQKGRSYNFDDLLEKDSTKTDSHKTEAIKFNLNNIQILNSSIKYTDLLIDHSVTLDKIELMIPGFSWNNESANLAIDFNFTDGGALYSKLTLNQTDSLYSLQLKLKSVNLSMIQPYFSRIMPVNSLIGTITSDIIINGDLHHLMQFNIIGSNHVSNMQLTDTLNRTILTFNKLIFNFDSIQPTNNKYKFKNINLDKPSALLEFIDSTNNWIKIFKPSNTKKSKNEVPGQEKKPLDFSIDEFTVTDGIIFVKDKNLRYPFNYQLNKLTISSQKISNTSPRIKVDISANLNKTGKLRSKLEINALNLSKLKIDLTVNQLRLSDLNAYLKHYLGYSASTGIIDFNTSNVFLPKSLVSENTLEAFDIKLNETNKSSAIVKMALPTAISMLSNPIGKLEIDIPIELKDNTAKVKYLHKIILRELGAILSEASGSPYDVIADNYKVDPNELKKISFGLFDTKLNQDNLNTLETVADILIDKPSLIADFTFSANKKRMGDSLAYIYAFRKYKDYIRETGRNPRMANDVLLLEYLIEKRYQTKGTGRNQLYSACRSFIGEKIVNKQVDSICNEQHNYVQKYLTNTKGLLSQRFMLNPMPGDVKADTIDLPGFIINLSLPNGKNE